MERILDFDAALDLVLAKATVIDEAGEETLSLLEAHGRVLSQAITADRDQPPFDRSTRDGFAVQASPELSRRIVGQLRAGEQWMGKDLDADAAVEIMTGAPVPPGANAVLMVEHVQVDAAAHRLSFSPDRLPVAGQNIVPRGAELREGQIALAAGVRLAASEIAVAAALGAHHVSVYRRPRVAILATGDELVELTQTPEPQQIRNSNSYALAALVSEAGAEAVRFPIVADRADDLALALAEARECDLILLSGGVSMGKYDLVEAALANAGAEFFFTGVRMQPGKPVVFGLLPAASQHPATFFFGLPGNPISTQVTFLCFVAPLLCALCGNAALAPPFAQATLSEVVPAKAGLTRLLPARLTHDARSPTVRLVPWQGSGDLAANALANCYALLPADHDHAFQPGEVISILLR